MSGLSRRQFLAAGGGLTLAGALSACGSPIASSLTGSQPQTADVIFWHLFGGGDGANMTTMVDKIKKSTGMSVESTLLSWGNPYYTKLALAASSGRPPDVAVAHLSRLPLLAQAGLLEPVDTPEFESLGITKEKFTPAAWSKATVGDRVYAVPLDTHPFVLFYNKALAKKAGLATADGQDLKPIKGRTEFVDALKAMKEASGGSYGAVATITADPSTCWRFFTMLYSGTAGSITADQGTRVTIDRGAMEETFAFMQSLTKKLRLMPPNATVVTSTTMFSQGKVGFLFDGEWQIPTYRGVKQANGKELDFNVVPFPAILGPKPVAYADSHSLIIPRSTARSATRSGNAATFIKGLINDSSIWAGGGHIPAWLPVQKSPEFRKLKPQSNYIEAAFNAVYDPAGWYTGAGSDFQTAMGSAVAGVLSGSTTPQGGVDALVTSLKTFSTARPPVK
jgi:multiple sugar transport system substrate-binding protein